MYLRPSKQDKVFYLAPSVLRSKLRDQPERKKKIWSFMRDGKTDGHRIVTP